MKICKATSPQLKALTDNKTKQKQHWTKAVFMHVKQASAETEIHMEHFWAAVVSSMALVDI